MNASCSGGDRLERRRGVHDERIPAHPREGPHPVRGAARLVIHDELDRVSARGVTRALLPPVIRRLGEHAIEDDLLGVVNVERRLPWLRIHHGHTPQPEAVQEPVGEPGGRRCERQRVLHEHEVPRPLRAWKRVNIRDVRDRIGQRARAGDVVRHSLVPARLVRAATSSSGCSAGCSQRATGGGIIQHLLECRVHAQQPCGSPSPCRRSSARRPPRSPGRQGRKP